jgi:hypothetical protein
MENDHSWRLPRTSYLPAAISIPVAVSKRFTRESGNITFHPYPIN